MTALGSLAWPEADERAAGTVIALPVGSTEQHGPHLPLSTDTDIAVALAERLAARVPSVLVAPAVPFGSSGEHAGFGGTLSIGQEALEHLLVELGRSADAFRGVIIVSAHGGNAAPVRRAVELLISEGRRVASWSPPAGDPADTHAGCLETSLMLEIAPALVSVDRAVAGDRRPLAEILPELRRRGVASVSASGVLGDPTGASAEAGRAALDRWVDDLVAAVETM